MNRRFVALIHIEHGLRVTLERTVLQQNLFDSFLYAFTLI